MKIILMILGALLLVGCATTSRVSVKNEDLRWALCLVGKSQGASVIMRDAVKGNIPQKIDLALPGAVRRVAESAGFRVYEDHGFYVVHEKGWEPSASLKNEITTLPGKRDRRCVFSMNGFLHEILPLIARDHHIQLEVPEELAKGEVTTTMVHVPALSAIKIVVGVFDCSLKCHDGVYELEIPPSMRDRLLDRDFRAFLDRAAAGDADAQYEAWKRHPCGTHDAKAVSWLRKAARQGYARARIELAELCIQGGGVPKDEAKGVRMLRNLAERGNTEAIYRMGIHYMWGEGVPKDDAEAFRWFLRSAEKNYPKAHLQLGYSYEEGRGVRKDDWKAVEYYRRAAEQGEGYAQFLLGERYAEGRGVERDYTEAARWYRRAAERNYPWAQYELGLLYLKGRGVGKDYVKAYYWTALASRQIALEKYEGQIEDVVDRMTPEQIEAGKRQVAEYDAQRKAADSKRH